MANALTDKLLLAALLLGSGAVRAQALEAPLPLQRAPAAPAGPLDVAEAPMLAAPSAEGSFQAWYAAEKRPALVVYFDRKLAELPPGWQGSTRLLIEDSKLAEGKESNRRVTVGVQHNTQAAAGPKSQFAALFEQAVQQEMKHQGLRLLDPSVLQRRQAAAGRGEGADIEFAALKGTTRFVFEVSLLVMNGDCELVGELKDLQSGELTATVRYRVDGGIGSPADLDRASRALVQRLLRYRMS